MRHRSRWSPAGVVRAVLVGALAACVPVTVNITIPQEKLEAAARQIEDMPAQTGPAPTPTPAPARSGQTTDVTPRIDTRSPEVGRASQSRRERRPTLREWKDRGCIGETNQGTVVARPGLGCGAEVAALIRAENADRLVIYDAFMRDNNIPASDRSRVQSAFAKTRQERARANDWVQLADGQWVRKQ
jgi:uncharacterized protein YdbL (DUF1318 family)